MSIPDLIWLAGDSHIALDGAAPSSDHALWESRGLAQTSGQGSSFRRHFHDDFDLMAESGLRAVRLTIDWARVEPFSGRVDQQEVERLEQIYAAANDRHLAVWTTLHNGSLPGWFSMDTDGFCTTRGPSIHWSRHVERMAERFDSATHVWAPVDDPVGWAVGGYHFGSRPPGAKVNPTTGGKLIDAVNGSIEATFEAHRILSSGVRPIAGIFRPWTVRAGTDLDGVTYNDEQKWWDDVFWRSWTHAIREGELAIPGRARVERAHMAGAFDLLMIGAPGVATTGLDGQLMEWATSTPESLSTTLHRTAELLPEHDLIVVGPHSNSGDQDDQLARIESGLEQLSGAVADGLAIKGVMLEPLFDGYDPRLGRWLENGLFTRGREPKEGFRLIEAQW